MGKADFVCERSGTSRGFFFARFSCWIPTFSVQVFTGAEQDGERWSDGKNSCHSVEPFSGRQLTKIQWPTAAKQKAKYLLSAGLED